MSYDQLTSEFFFKTGYMRTERLLRDMQLLGSPGKAFFTGKFIEEKFIASSKLQK